MRLIISLLIVSAIAIVAGVQWIRADNQIAHLKLEKMLAEHHLKRIERQKDMALAVVNDFTYELPNELKKIPGTDGLIRGILEYNIDRSRKIYAVTQNDRHTQSAQAANFIAVADLWFNLLGESDRALGYYHQALGIVQRQVKQDPDNRDAQQQLAHILNALGNLSLHLKQSDQALSFYQQALGLVKKLVEEDSGNSLAKRDLKEIQNSVETLQAQVEPK